jgi:hypothetical protein
MVQSKDNLSSLRGTLIGRSAHPSLDGYELLDVDIQATSPVDDRPDLLATTVGTRVAVTVLRALLDETVRPGVTLICQARRTPDGAMAVRRPGFFRTSPD